MSVLPIQVMIVISIIIRLLAVPRCRGEGFTLVLEPNLAFECGWARVCVSSDAEEGYLGGERLSPILNRNV